MHSLGINTPTHPLPKYHPKSCHAIPRHVMPCAKPSITQNHTKHRVMARQIVARKKVEYPILFYLTCLVRSSPLVRGNGLLRTVMLGSDLSLSPSPSPPTPLLAPDFDSSSAPELSLAKIA